MTYRIKFLIAVCVTMLCIGCNLRHPDRYKGDLDKGQIALADSILLYFQQEQFEDIVVHFDNKLKAQLNKEQLAVIWAQLNTQMGKYWKSGYYKTEKLNAVGDRITYECYFGTQKLHLQFVFGNENRIMGIFFVPKLK